MLRVRWIPVEREVLKLVMFIARNVIGEHPSVAQINQYAIAKALPSEYRKVFQYVSIVDSGNSVVGNFRIGLSVTF